jgi:hypothetical protein
VISTPYVYARELLAEGRGILVPFHDAQAIAREVIELLGDDAKRLTLRERGAAYGRSMMWPAVARRYVESFERARAEHADRMRTAFRVRTLATRPVGLPELNLEHLRVMTDGTGILQHASFSVPRYAEGYCLDDNARALLLMTLIEEAGADDPGAARVLTSRYLAFVSHAFNVDAGRFRNFMSYSRQWAEESGSEDSHGRALWALGAVVGRCTDPGRQSLSGDLFHAALPVVSTFTSPRAWAFALLGIDEYLRAFRGDSNVQATRCRLAERLLDLYRRTSSGDWQWFEDRVTYSNARLPQALLVTGTWIRDDEMVAAGTRSLEWLATAQHSKDGYFVPVGSNGFYTRGTSGAAFDQQPVEACAMVSACLEARRVTGDERWSEHARRAFRWFLGENQLQKPLYDASTGGCRDGLHPDRPNENQGAEATLSFLLALLEMRSAERADSAIPTSREITE